MSISFRFYLDGTSSSSRPNFCTGVASIGESYLRSPEAFGLHLPDEIRAKVAELFPVRDSITKELMEIQQGKRSQLLAQISGLSVKYGKI